MVFKGRVNDADFVGGVKDGTVAAATDVANVVDALDEQVRVTGMGVQAGSVCQTELLWNTAKKSISWHIEAEKNGRHFADDIFKRIVMNENA